MSTPKLPETTTLSLSCFTVVSSSDSGEPRPRALSTRSRWVATR